MRGLVLRLASFPLSTDLLNLREKTSGGLMDPC